MSAHVDPACRVDRLNASDTEKDLQKAEPVNPNPKQRSRGRGNNGGNPNRIGGHGGGGGGGGHSGQPRNINVRSQVFDSNGPEGRIRGNAHQVMEKYLALARDASSQGDRHAAENFYQHAEHYFRLINAYNQSNGQRRPQNLPTPAEDQLVDMSGDDDEMGDRPMDGDYAAEAQPVPAPQPERRQPRVAPPVAEAQPEMADAEPAPVAPPVAVEAAAAEDGAGDTVEAAPAPKPRTRRRRAPVAAAEPAETPAEPAAEPVLL